jgi:hypothetical protein
MGSFVGEIFVFGHPIFWQFTSQSLRYGRQEQPGEGENLAFSIVLGCDLSGHLIGAEVDPESQDPCRVSEVV